MKDLLHIHSVQTKLHIVIMGFNNLNGELGNSLFVFDEM